MNTVAILLMLGIGQVGPDEESEVYRVPEDDLLDAIHERGYRRVGILPRFIVRGNDDEFFGGNIGPLGDHLAEQLHRLLLRVRNRKFGLIDARQMRTAFEEMAISDLGNREKLREAARRVGGMDALLVGVVSDQKQHLPDEDDLSGLEIEYTLKEIQSSTDIVSVDVFENVTLTDAAYMGRSWEVRRWKGAKLYNVALEPADEPVVLSYMRILGERKPAKFMDPDEDFCELVPNAVHPLKNDRCPYRLAIVVEGEERKVVDIGNRLYAVLHPGENFQIHVTNATRREAFVSVFVDGINILGKKREHPRSARYWLLKGAGNGQTQARFDGWYTPVGNGKHKLEEFIVVPTDDSVATNQGFDQRLGLITTVFYTVGLKGIPREDSYAAAAQGGRFEFAIGAAAKESLMSLEMKSRPKRGIMLAAMTVYYATESRLRALQAGSDEADDTPEPPAPGG